MKECPTCQLVSPDTAEVCDCGYSFRTGGATCPHCHSAEGLQYKGVADRDGRMVAGLLGGAAARQLLYGSPCDEFHCAQCGHSFRVPRRRKPNLLSLAIGLIIVLDIVLIVVIVTG